MDIFEAIRKQDKDTICQMLDEWPELVDKVNQNGATLLHFAALESTRDIVDMLLEYGSYVNARDYRGWTPMRYALLAGKDDIYRLLRLRGGVDY